MVAELPLDWERDSSACISRVVHESGSTERLSHTLGIVRMLSYAHSLSRVK